MIAMLVNDIHEINICTTAGLLAKVCRVLISVCCLELRGVHFLEVQNVIVL